jgi:hypothetical protein
MKWKITGISVLDGAIGSESDFLAAMMLRGNSQIITINSGNIPHDA